MFGAVRLRLVAFIVTGLAGAVVGWSVRPMAHAASPVTTSAGHRASVAHVEGMRVVEDIPQPSAVPAPPAPVAALTLTLSHPAPGPIQMSLTYPGHYIMLGSTGPLVQLIQRTLHVKADGIFGPKTAGAVMKFQSDNGLTVDGIVGPITWHALFG